MKTKFIKAVSIAVFFSLVLVGVAFAAGIFYPDNGSCTPILASCGTVSNLFGADDIYMSCPPSTGIGACVINGNMRSFYGGGRITYKVSNLANIENIGFQLLFLKDSNPQSWKEVSTNSSNGVHVVQVDGAYTGAWRMTFAAEAGNGVDYIRVEPNNSDGGTTFWAYILSGLIGIINSFILPFFGDAQSQSGAMSLARYLTQGGYIAFELIYDVLGSVVNLTLFGVFFGMLIIFFFIRLFLAVYLFILKLIPGIGH